MRFDRRTFLAITSGAAASTAASARVAAASRVREMERSMPPSLLPRGASSRFTTVNGIRMHYVIAGSGPAVLLLHGWPQTWYAWAETIRILSDRFTVVAPDLRGTGLSERTASGYDKRTIASDLSDLVDKVAGGAAHVIAHDMGGKAAYVLALLQPERVRKLVLVDCLVPGTENTDVLHGGSWHYGFHMAPNVPELLTAGREHDYIHSQIRAWSHRKDAISEQAVSEYARHYAAPGGMTAGFNYYRTLPEDARFVASLPTRKLAMPVLAIGGGYGVGTKLADILRPDTDHLSSVVAENSGHFVAEEMPGFFHDTVQRFLVA